MSNGKDKKKSNSPKPNDPTGQRMYFEWTSEEGGEEDVFAKRGKHRKSFWKTGPNVKVRNKGLAGAEVTKKGGAYAFYRKKSKAAQLFRKAFADAKAAGKKTFTWDGRSYTTETAEKPEKKKPRSMKKGGTVKETGIYKLHKGEKVVPVKKKKKAEPKLRPQPEWEVSDFQWVPDPDKLGALKLRYTESGVKKKRKIATHKAKTEGKKGFPYRPTHKIEKEKNP